MGYLGGPNFPDDPTDLGPLVPLPGGFIEVFEFLKSVGYDGFEFFQFSQNVNELGRQPTIAEIRTYLDNAGLVAHGTHTAGLGTMYSAALGGLSPAGQLQIDNAHTLGMPMIGTAGDPTNSSVLATVGTTIGWEEVARRANLIGEVLRAEGLVWYWHVEQNGFQGFNATVHPELVGKNRMTWFFEHTTPDTIMNETDVFHSYAGRARFPFPGWTAADPYNPAFLWDAWGWWQENHGRVVGWHIKDGTRLATQPLPPGNPFTQTVTRPPTFAPGGLANNDALYAGEGSIAQGYPVDPDPGMVGFDTLFHKTKKVEKGAPASSSPRATTPSGRPPIPDGRSATPSSRRSTCSARRRRAGRPGATTTSTASRRANAKRSSPPGSRHAGARGAFAVPLAPLPRPPMKPLLTRLLLAVLVMTAAALAGATAARAHGDPASHYLEGDSLYPAVADRPSQAVELQLMGLLQAADRLGYPIKLALVANEEDLAYDLTMLKKPQAYAEFVAGQIGGPGALEAPLVVVTPYGFGIAGSELNDGRLQPVTHASARVLLRGLRISERANGDALAAAGTAAVRQIAAAGGHPLPAKVPPASATWAGATGTGEADDGGLGIDLRLFAVLFTAVFVVAVASLELWLRRGRRRAGNPAA